MLTVKGLTDIGRGTLGTDSGAGNELKPTNKQANRIKIAHKFQFRSTKRPLTSVILSFHFAVSRLKR